MNKRVIITDVDGVILDWEEGFSVWLEHKGFKPIPDAKKYWDMGARYKLDYEEILSHVHEFNSSASIGFLPPQRDAQHYIKLINKELGYRFIALTSCSGDPNVAKLRTRNLEKLLGPVFDDIICIPVGSDKTPFLEAIATDHPGSYWVEDTPKNVDKGIALGYRGLLFQHKFNLDYDGEARVIQDWEEIYNLLKAEP